MNTMLGATLLHKYRKHIKKSHKPQLISFLYGRENKACYPWFMDTETYWKKGINLSLQRTQNQHHNYLKSSIGPWGFKLK